MEVGEVGGRAGRGRWGHHNRCCGAMPPELPSLLVFASAAELAVPGTLDGCSCEGGSSCWCWEEQRAGTQHPSLQ